jgi:hypothetical protein
MEFRPGDGRAPAGDQRRRAGQTLACGIAPKLFGLSPMMNLRFTIYDLRLVLANERRAGIFSNRKSSIINHKFSATISLIAKG